MTRGHALYQRITSWWHGTNWQHAVGGFDPDDARRDESDRIEFERRQEQRFARLARLEMIAGVKADRERGRDVER